MPVSLTHRLPQQEEARIEIVPLIDIVFFLLAIFMLVSLSMVNLNAIKVDLPTATRTDSETPNDNLLSLSIDRHGTVFLEKTPVAPNELKARLHKRFAANPSLRVFVSGDIEARHGDIIRVLDQVRSAGIQHVAFEIQPES